MRMLSRIGKLLHLRQFDRTVDFGTLLLRPDSTVQVGKHLANVVVWRVYARDFIESALELGGFMFAVKNYSSDRLTFCFGHFTRNLPLLVEHVFLVAK